MLKHNLINKCSRHFISELLAVSYEVVLNCYIICDLYAKYKKILL